MVAIKTTTRGNGGPQIEGYERANFDLATEMAAFDSASAELRAAIANAPVKISAAGTLHKYSTDYSRLIAVNALAETIFTSEIYARQGSHSSLPVPGKRG